MTSFSTLTDTRLAWFPFMSLGNVRKERIIARQGTYSVRALRLSTGAVLIFLYKYQFVTDFSIYERTGYIYRVFDC